VNFRDKMPGDSIANFKLFPSDDELSPSSQPSAKDKDPPYDPRFNRANCKVALATVFVYFQIFFCTIQIRFPRLNVL
jgi:hypothetical protein